MNYTFTISEAERQAFAEFCAIMARKLGTATPIIDAQSGTDQARAILSPPSSPSTRPSGQTTPAVKSASPPIEALDRWQRDRKGNEVPWPKGCEEVERVIAKTEQKDKYLRVSWQAIGPDARGYVSANCFDQKLWPWLIKQTGQKTTMYLLKSEDGKFTNVVGVRA